MSVANGGNAWFQTITGLGPERDADWWIGPAQRIALLIWISIPVLGFFFRDIALSIGWRVVVVSLPLFIVLAGYHRWRRICPLSMFTKAPGWLHRPGSRRAGKWLQANYYYVTAGMFVIALWLRITATNVDGRAMALFFVGISLSALAIGALFTGKTWCNHICPLSFIEKIYTEPHGLRETANSQCVKCTACKTACPDINEENAFWKEVDSEPKQRVYYAFPGLVFGFFFYNYLQSQSWQAFFNASRRWHQPPGDILASFKPGTSAANGGFYFTHGVPIAVAGALTLLVGALASYVIFRLLEGRIAGWLRRQEPDADTSRFRSYTFALSACAAFVIFYGFAGYPSVSIAPWLQDVMRMAAVGVASVVLVRRLKRTRGAFAEETLSRNIIKQWDWPDQPPRDLHDVFLVHTIRSTERQNGRERVVRAYEDAVRETLGTGMLTREEVQVLESMRQQLGITQPEHDAVMARLDEEDRTAISEARLSPSLEKRVQMESYRRALAPYVESGAPDADSAAIRHLRREYVVTQAEHLEVLDELLGGSESTARRLESDVAETVRASKLIDALRTAPSARRDFLAYLLADQRSRQVGRLVTGLRLAGVGLAGWLPERDLASEDEAKRRAALQIISEWISAGIGQRLLAAYDLASQEEASLQEMLAACVSCPDAYVRAAAVYAMTESGTADAATLEALSADSSEVVAEAARWASTPADVAALPVIGAMAAFHALPLFAALTPEGLAPLAASSRYESVLTGGTLWVEGDAGDEIDVLLSGTVEVTQAGRLLERVDAKEGAGAVLSELSVFDPLPRTSTVVAVGPVAVLRLDGVAFHAAAQKNPGVAESVMQELARRLQGSAAR